jgi:hypothetical protein
MQSMSRTVPGAFDVVPSIGVNREGRGDQSMCVTIGGAVLSSYQIGKAGDFLKK